MTQEELAEKIFASLPADIAEKVKSETISEEELQTFVVPLIKKLVDNSEGNMISLSDDQLENVSGGFDLLGNVLCIATHFWNKREMNKCISENK